MKNILRRLFNKEVLIVFACTLLVSFIINLTKLDILIQNIFYSHESGWILKKAEPWNFFYHYSFIPPLVISISAFFLLGRTFIDIKRIKYRKIAAFLVIVMALGPGLFVNLVLKENWGRPRPRDILQFNGKYTYEEVLTIDRESEGKSFPCGHCSMGFFTFSLFFIFRKRKHRLANTSLLLSLILGGLIGFARIVQGGHFFSDVLWAGFVTYFTASCAYYALSMDKDLFYNPKDLSKFKKYHSVNILMHILMTILAFLVLLATPYSKSKLYHLKKIANFQYTSVVADLNFLETNLIVSADTLIALKFHGEGFGFPKSKIKNSWKYELNSPEIHLNFNQKKSGFLTEFSQENRLLINPKKQGFYKIKISDSIVEIDTSELEDITLLIQDIDNLQIDTKDLETHHDNSFGKGKPNKITVEILSSNSKIIVK